MIICECGEVIDGGTFRDYIKTTANPSTPTIGHEKCGCIFNFIDEKMPRKYSSRRELKSIAIRFAEKNNFESGNIEKFMIQVDKLKSNGNLSDNQILHKAFNNIIGNAEF